MSAAPCGVRRLAAAFRSFPIRRRRQAAALHAALFFAACHGRQSALDPAGKQAGDIARLWWIFFAVAAIAWAVTITFLLIGAFRRDRIDSSERRLKLVVMNAAALVIVMLFGLLIASVMTGNAIMKTSGRTPLQVRVTGQQWWWSVDYHDPVPSKSFTTANEIHVPVGHPVEVVLESRDVIHSFWIPSVHGKRDLIPGKTTQFVIEVEKPGVYEGQCAEFCGLQHAKMRLLLVAEPMAQYAKWAELQRQPGRNPQTTLEKRGQEVFLAASCPMCHNVGGTPASARRGPDLTHIASRRMLAANSIPNTTGHLAGWIVDPQSTKPGTAMPPNSIPSTDLQALLAYLRSLK